MSKFNSKKWGEIETSSQVAIYLIAQGRFLLMNNLAKALENVNNIQFK
jgi:hypothetical protein